MSELMGHIGVTLLKAARGPYDARQEHLSFLIRTAPCMAQCNSRARGMTPRAQPSFWAVLDLTSGCGIFCTGWEKSPHLSPACRQRTKNPCAPHLRGQHALAFVLPYRGSEHARVQDAFPFDRAVTDNRPAPWFVVFREVRLACARNEHVPPR